MKTTTRWTAGLGATALTALSLTGCSSDGGSDGGRIVYWASNQGTSITQDEEILAESIARFTEATGVEVQLEVIPWTDLYNRILTAVSSGEGPDVLNIGNTWAVSLQSSGAFLPWEGEALEAIGGEGRFVASSWATGGADGQVPASVPLYGLAYSMYYNTAMFEEAGIAEPPATWEEFVETAKTLTVDTDGDGRIDQWGAALAGSSITGNAHAAFIRGLQNGGALYDADGDPDFANDGVVAGVDQWIQLMGEDGVVSPSNAELLNGSEIVAEFIDGNAAMFFDQAPGKTLDAAGMEDYAAAPMPMVTADATGLEGTQSHVAGINVSVFENADDPEAAIDFVAHLTSDEEQRYLNDAFTSLPVVTEAYDDPAFQSDEIALKQQILSEHAQPMPLYPTEGQMETLVGTAIKDLFARIAQGGTVTEDDVREALEDAAAQMPSS
ncbi:sugar ABC transporter substrate-binding protein [Microbacterium betulae]|uniref:Sugar ABC transporter substrate-binding protein n=1 Tax=Microbacterium betulae TaxID=2981139 RepID=A0AA97I555_9MICO|nr:sugar ABC transporter substrate-binding protein [Microbacterium sp. AB]WOF23341.1 sugar ABC transporter substrate-binding protein [Microbacterium sp. AB]